MEKKIRVGAVSYLNTKPLIYGLESGMMSEKIELTYGYPSNIASRLLNNDIDLGLVPIAILPRMKEAHIITDYCIGSEGAVASVCIFSDVPIEQATTVLLDYQSRTSVALAKILLKEYWNLAPTLVDGGKDFRDHINGTTAGLVIGDRAFEQRKTSSYFYDLGYYWKLLTGLPFIFAAWVSNRKLDNEFIHSFNDTNKAGLQNIDQIVSDNPYVLFDLRKYYMEFVNYDLSADKVEGMKLFLEKLSSL